MHVFIVCIYLYCHGRSNYQEREGWNPINLFNPATILCMSKTELGLQTLYVVVFFCVEWFEVVVRFVDINGIVLLTITI